mgnify:CR=1 FL=1
MKTVYEIGSCLTIAFYGQIDVLPAIGGQYLIKLAMALCDTPLVYVAVWWVKKLELAHNRSIPL